MPTGAPAAPTCNPARCRRFSAGAAIGAKRRSANWCAADGCAWVGSAEPARAGRGAFIFWAHDLFFGPTTVVGFLRSGEVAQLIIDHILGTTYGGASLRQARSGAVRRGQVKSSWTTNVTPRFASQGSA